MKTFDNTWEQVHKDKDWGKYPSEEVIRFIARNYYKRCRENIKVLDIGCGAGAQTWYLAREGFDTYGLDGSQSAIMKAKKRLENDGLQAEFKVEDASSTGYEDQLFDVVVDSALIYANRLEGVRNILKEIYRILKPQGKIFSTGLFNSKTTGYATGEKLEKNTYRNLEEGPIAGLGTIHFFEDSEIVELWKEAGFKEIKIDIVTRSDRNQDSIVSYYIVEAMK